MNLGQRGRRGLITAAVFLLVIGVISLAALAKASQYGTASKTGYLKSTKMSDTREQRSVTLPASVTIQFIPTREPVAVVRASFDGPAVRPAPFLEAFRFRPPPTRML